MNDPVELSDLRSGVLTSPADALLGEAIASTLRLPAEVRAVEFEDRMRGIEDYMKARPEERPWTCSFFTGTDGSRVFRGGVGHSLVIDPDGRLWRARSYEDFLTTYAISEKTCEIETLTPLYPQMREYLQGKGGEIASKAGVPERGSSSPQCHPVPLPEGL